MFAIDPSTLSNKRMGSTINGKFHFFPSFRSIILQEGGRGGGGGKGERYLLLATALIANEKLPPSSVDRELLKGSIASDLSARI